MLSGGKSCENLEQRQRMSTIEVGMPLKSKECGHDQGSDDERRGVVGPRVSGIGAARRRLFRLPMKVSVTFIASTAVVIILELVFVGRRIWLLLKSVSRLMEADYPLIVISFFRSSRTIVSEGKVSTFTFWRRGTY